MIWLVSPAYGAAVLVVATALVFLIIWLVEKLAVKDRRRAHARIYWLIRWLGSKGSTDEGPRLRSRAVPWGESNRASALSTSPQVHFGPAGVWTVGVGKTPRLTKSSTALSEMLNSPANSARVTY
jgi:hypothetical protein